MAYVLRQIVQGYFNLWESRDTRLNYLPFMNSPMSFFLVVGGYVYFAQIGPKLMENRKPYNIKKIIIIYNIVQIIVNGLFTITLWRYALNGRFSFMCQAVLWDNSADSQFLVRCSYMYLMLKLLDFFDTIFFILRKKSGHVTFLHVYHHSMISIGCYLQGLFAPAGQTFLVGAINTFVHSIMYTYYLMTIWYPEIRANIAVKKAITSLQMIQFTIFLIHFSHGIFFTGNECGYPVVLSFTGIVQNLFMLSLFGDFFYKNYVAIK